MALICNPLHRVKSAILLVLYRKSSFFRKEHGRISHICKKLDGAVSQESALEFHVGRYAINSRGKGVKERKGMVQRNIMAVYVKYVPCG